MDRENGSPQIASGVCGGGRVYIPSQQVKKKQQWQMQGGREEIFKNLSEWIVSRLLRKDQGGQDAEIAAQERREESASYMLQPREEVDLGEVEAMVVEGRKGLYEVSESRRNS